MLQLIYMTRPSSPPLCALNRHPLLLLLRPHVWRPMMVAVWQSCLCSLSLRKKKCRVNVPTSLARRWEEEEEGERINGVYSQQHQEAFLQPNQTAQKLSSYTAEEDPICFSRSLPPMIRKDILKVGLWSGAATNRETQNDMCCMTKRYFRVEKKDNSHNEVVRLRTAALRLCLTSGKGENNPCNLATPS
jgi:hypothetical protein